MFKNIFVTSGKLICLISEMFDYRIELPPKKVFFAIKFLHDTRRSDQLKFTMMIACFFRDSWTYKTGSIGFYFKSAIKVVKPACTSKAEWEKPASWATPAAQCADHGDVVYVSESALFALGVRFFYAIIIGTDSELFELLNATQFWRGVQPDSVVWW